MSKIEVSLVRAFTDNYIWLIKNPLRREVLVVDPGESKPVIAALETLDYALLGILITHKHQDHIGGVADLLKYQKVPVFGNAKENIPETINQSVQEGITLNFEGWPEIAVIEAPGHTLGHVLYLLDNKLFCGDTLFSAGCGRIFEGTPQQMFSSVNKIKSLPDETLIYCAHEYTAKNLSFAHTLEPENQDIIDRQKQVKDLCENDLPSLPSNILIEKKTNPFFRYDSHALKKSIAEFKGRVFDDPIDVFKYTREWRNQW